MSTRTRPFTPMRLTIVCLYGCFFDYAKLDNRQSALNMFASCVHVHNERVPLGSFHRNIFCKCGCRGAHTFQPIWDLIAWMFRILATGKYPDKDYYGNPWPEHSWRRLEAGMICLRVARGSWSRSALIWTSMPRLLDSRTTEPASGVLDASSIGNTWATMILVVAEGSSNGDWRQDKR